MTAAGSLDLVAARTVLADGAKALRSVRFGELRFAAHRRGSDLWVTVSRGEDDGGLAWRVALFDENAEIESIADSGLLSFAATSPLGRHRIVVQHHPGQTEEFLLRVVFRARQSLHVPYIPRDLIVVGTNGKPEASSGRIEARQRKLNTGLCYFNVDRPALGKVLYVQDLTELADYFEATGTKPESSVGGEWPEVGYLAPTQPGDSSKVLPGGREVTLCHAHLIIRRFAEDDEGDSAWQFLDMLGAVYRRLRKPAWHFRDWIARSRATLRDLSRAPEARTRHFGEVYFHPYTGAEHPDIMVQLSLLSAIRDWSRWSGKRHPLEREIRNGLARFYDRKLQTLRRYLPDVGADKDRDAVDSWYLYHPLLNLSNLALDGDQDARKLFFDTVGYGIRAARHFGYKWPIMFKVGTFAVIRAVAPSDGRGQTDVGGIYAWVMLQAFELSGEAEYLSEAKAAIAAAQGMRFDLNYQANLTAWGAAACIRLWRITNDRHYLEQSYVYLASFFHNSQIWESRIGHARHYSNFLAVTCLEDAPYMAIYECFDSFAAFERYLDLGGPDLIPAVKLLVSEYCRYALDRGWSAYPDALPKEALATENRNGHIDRKLSFPLEDLYPDGQPAGQVGQEIYGAGAAMVFATRAFHRVERAPFVINCDHFLCALTRVDERAVSFTLDGAPGQAACVTLVAKRRNAWGEPRLLTADGREMPCVESNDRLMRFEVAAQGFYVLSWSA